MAHVSDFYLCDEMSVPIFFSSLVGPSHILIFGYSIAAVLGMLFGAIHCAGWNLAFPSITEEHTWRIASIFVVGYPTLFVLMQLAQILCESSFAKVNNYLITHYMLWIMIFWSISLCLYVMARLFILLEAFLALRNLPDSVTYTVQWTAFLPHV